MFTLVWLPLIVQVAVPLWLVARVASGDMAPSRVSFTLDAAIAGAWIVAVAQAGLWLALPPWLPWLWCVLLLLAVGRGLSLGRQRPVLPVTSAARRGVALRTAALITIAGLAAGTAAGRAVHEAGAIDITLPLEGGTYVVANGGGLSLINAHLGTLTEARFRDWRGQSYGVDLVKRGRWGSRVRGRDAEDVADYAIFNAPVVAPCAGRVVMAVDGRPDMPPLQPDRTYLSGNHVILDCAGVWVVLAHFRCGSVRVRPGQYVDAGDALGRVGNSGNSWEPHLHVHAQRPGTADAPLGGEPLPLRIDGRVPVRNARFDDGGG